jgi:hypothetical protein
MHVTIAVAIESLLKALRDLTVPPCITAQHPWRLLPANNRNSKYAPQKMRPLGAAGSHSATKRRGPAPMASAPCKQKQQVFTAKRSVLQTLKNQYSGRCGISRCHHASRPITHGVCSLQTTAMKTVHGQNCRRCNTCVATRRHSFTRLARQSHQC